MSLRLRLFLLIGALVALLVLAQWWWVHLLTRDLSSELDVVVTKVGESVVAFFKDPVHSSHAPGFHAPGSQTVAHHETAAHHETVISCAGDDCDGTFVRHLERFASAEELLERIDDEVIVQALRRIEATAEDEAAIDETGTDETANNETAADETADEAEGTTLNAQSFTYRFEQAEQEGEKTAKRVQIHIEHLDGDRYLWVGEPKKRRKFQIPEQGFSDKLDRFSQRMVFGSAGFLLLGLAIAGVVSHRVTRPLRQLASAAREVGDGALGTQVDQPAEGEVGEAIVAFNRMSGQLEELDARARALAAHRHLGEIGEIARGLAHTLRNPLNALGLSVEELAAQSAAAQNGLAGATPELAESARRQIRRIDHSIRSFLALASQSGGVLSEVDVGELIEDVSLEALQDGRGKVQLDIDAASGLPRLRGVEPELRAVLQALVVNAIEASPKEGRVSVRTTTPAPGRLRVELEDQGPGLPEEVRERLFTPHLSTKANGSGMGLFLAHRIATNRYGGRLELQDRSAGGTRAILEIGERERALSEADEGSRDG
ncbi:MAG: HAMP domain-containing sensor histidine kinase [Acidobacteriota bacterium]